MATRKRLSSETKTPPKDAAAKPDPKSTIPPPLDPPLSPPKYGAILKLSCFFLIPYVYLMTRHYEIDPELKGSILINAGLSLFGYFATVRLIPVASRYVLRRNLFGYDINKKGTPQGSVKVPESLGIVVGIVFLVLAILFQFSNFTADSNWLVEYNAALASVCFMILLGFVDDVLDVPWRIKLILPSFAALPLLMAYAGHTTIIIPKPLVPYIGLEILNLGWIYKLYMGLLAVFCTNSINIHAGLNGLEVGQTVVIAAAILIHNIMQIGASKDPEYQQAHAFSIYLVQPLLATSLGLLSYNWYPSAVFVGDTFTYFAGMTMAVVGILGHFRYFAFPAYDRIIEEVKREYVKTNLFGSTVFPIAIAFLFDQYEYRQCMTSKVTGAFQDKRETLLIFFLPQILNFLLSLPQLAGIVPCPRHRLPRFDPQTRLLTGTNDGTLVNLFLRLFGRKTEKSLCILLLVFQALGCCFCFLLRWLLAGWYK